VPGGSEPDPTLVTPVAGLSGIHDVAAVGLGRPSTAAT
jgi:hypothetical protein